MYLVLETKAIIQFTVVRIVFRPVKSAVQEMFEKDIYVLKA